MAIRQFILKCKRKVKDVWYLWEKYLLCFYIALDGTFVDNNVDDILKL